MVPVVLGSASAAVVPLIHSNPASSPVFDLWPGMGTGDYVQLAVAVANADHYGLGHFWLYAVLSLGAALASLKKNRPSVCGSFSPPPTQFALPVLRLLAENVGQR